MKTLNKKQQASFVSAMTAAFAAWRDSGKMTETTLDAAVDSVITVLDNHGLDALSTNWKGYKALDYSQAEYKAHWSPYNGVKRESELNALPPQMSLKNVRRMTNDAIRLQLQAVIDGAGWGRLSRSTSFTGSRTDSRLEESVNQERRERAATVSKTLLELVESTQARLEAKRAEQAAKKEAARAAKGTTPPVVDDDSNQDTGLV